MRRVHQVIVQRHSGELEAKVLQRLSYPPEYRHVPTSRARQRCSGQCRIEIEGPSVSQSSDEFPAASSNAIERRGSIHGALHGVFPVLEARLLRVRQLQASFVAPDLVKVFTGRLEGVVDACALPARGVNGQGK